MKLAKVRAIAESNAQRAVDDEQASEPTTDRTDADVARMLLDRGVDNFVTTEVIDTTTYRTEIARALRAIAVG